MAPKQSLEVYLEPSDHEELPFIEHDAKSPSPVKQDSVRLEVIGRRLHRVNWIAFLKGHVWLIHGTILLLYTSIFFVSLVISDTCLLRPGSSSVWSPAQEVVEYESRIIDAIPGSTPFTGYPNVKSDAAWTDSLKGINVKILPNEMERLGYTSLELADGSGYVGTLGVYHELHCLKRIRKMIYKDYYYPNITMDEWHHRMGHIEHCLEQIRQSAICHGDVNVIPFSWLKDEEHQIASPSMQFGSRHQCVKWDKVESWAKARRLDLFEEGLLVLVDVVELNDTI